MLRSITKFTALLTLSSLIMTSFAIAPEIAQGYGSSQDTTVDQPEDTVENDSTSTTDEVTTTDTATLTDAEIAADNVYTPAANDLIEFTMDVRWGYVRGNKELEKSEKQYNGSIYAGNTDEAKIGLTKKLLFETNDEVTLEKNPVTWTSKIFGHWDGVMVHVIAKADANIVVNAGDFTITKTAQEWFVLGEPALEHTNYAQMLVVKVNKKAHRRHGVLVWWGIKERTKCDDTPNIGDVVNSDALCVAPPTLDFSGSLTMDIDGFIKLKRSLRFENNDSIDEHDRNHIAWTSNITTGRDGLYTLILPNRDATLTSGFTIKFDKINIFDGGWSKHYTFEDIKNGSRETIDIDGTEYIVSIGRRHITKQLVKARTSRRLYLIENDVKHEVDNTDVLTANGFKEDDAELMDDDELATYEDGDDLQYPDGTVVEDDSNTYVIEDGQKRRLATPEVVREFTEARRLFARRISQLRLSKFVAGSDITDGDEITDESLIKVEGDTAVWRIRGNKRQVFTHLRIFDLHRLNFDRVRTITQEKFQEFDWAPPVEYPDGSLVKIPTDPKVYLLRGGLRHWVETQADLEGLGFNFSNIVDMPPTEIINYPEGDSVIADEATDVETF